MKHVLDPPSGDALGVLTSHEAAEEFVAGDPIVARGVVASWRMRPWREVLAPEGPSHAGAGCLAGSGHARMAGPRAR